MIEWIAWFSLAVAFASAAFIAIDELRHPQKMWIMNVVWPVTALYLSVIAVWWYFRVGRRMAKEGPAMKMNMDAAAPTFGQSALAASHCGAGCVLADIAIEFAAFGLGLTIAGSPLIASYVWDFVGAWALGIGFQYFTIKPMRNLTPAAGIVSAIKADTLSITAFQVGMYAWMALVRFRLFPRPHLHPDRAAFWLMMQIAMVCGFLTSIPMNHWLVSKGWKERMG